MDESNITTVETEPTVDYKAEYERLAAENEKLRKANTSASADASKYKKELAARMSEEERNKAEQAEANRALEEELKALRRDKAVSEHMASFLSVGYDDALAKSSAEAIVDGNTAAVFDGLKKFIALRDKAMNADAIRNTTKPGTGASNPTVTREQFNSMSYSERVKLFENDRELYDKLSK